MGQSAWPGAQGSWGPGVGGRLGSEHPRPAKVRGIGCKDTKVGVSERVWQPVGGEPNSTTNIPHPRTHTHSFSG